MRYKPRSRVSHQRRFARATIQLRRPMWAAIPPYLPYGFGVSFDHRLDRWAIDRNNAILIAIRFLPPMGSV